MSSSFVVVITGASSGIGAALARAYAEPGVMLGLAGRDGARLAEIGALCREAGAEVEILQADVTDADVMRVLLTGFDRRHPINLVIANAGVTSGMQPNGEPESWQAVQQVFAVNLMGALHTLTPVVERMRLRRRGQIAVIGSLAARYGLPFSPAYSASKAAIETYATALRGALAKDGIKVNVVSLGYITSPMSDRIKGPQPFKIDAEQAARLIRHGLARNRPQITFPRLLGFGGRLLGLLPARLADLLVRLFTFHVVPEPLQSRQPARRDAVDAR